MIDTPSRERRLDERIWNAVREANCELAFRRDFQITEPLWYGLWIQSPLTRTQCETLGAVFSRLAIALPRFQSEFEAFAALLQSAAQTGTAVTVELGPPGHVDFGWYTIFPHCPRCKAEVPLERWKGSYPESPIDCSVCGFNYSPAATYSREREFWGTDVECEECHQRLKVSEFSEAERDLLEEQALLKEMLDELKWLYRVGAFYKRYPDLKNAIKPEYLRVPMPDDPYKCEYFLAGGMPPMVGDRPWSDEDREVINYLKHHEFNIDGRHRFVRERVEQSSKTVRDKRVCCPQCGGRIEVPTGWPS